MTTYPKYILSPDGLTATYGETKLIAKDAVSSFSCEGCFFRLPKEVCLASRQHEDFVTGCIDNGFKIWVEDK